MKLKNIFAMAFACTLMIVGASGALAAPNQPTDAYHPEGQTPKFSHDTQYTAEDCASCHNPTSATMAGAHKNHNFDNSSDGYPDMDCNSCHGTAGPSSPEKVECGSCHTTTTRASWEITYKEDNSTPEIESGKDTKDPGDIDGDGNTSEPDGKPDGHHLYDLDSDGQVDDQNACTDCHGNMAYAVDGTQEGNVFTGNTADLGIDGMVEVFKYEGDDIANSVGIEPNKPDPEGQIVTSNSGSTLTVDNIAGTWTYEPAPDFYGTETFMLEGESPTDGSAQFVKLVVTSVDPNSDADGDGLTYDQEVNGANSMEYTSDPNKADTDDDGTNDYDEVHGDVDGWVTDPRNPDTDDDGLSDTDEIKYGTIPINYADENGNPVDGTDTDDDGLNDGAEVNDTKTDPLNSDTDKDGINDGDEVAAKTDPTKADTDGDGVNDKEDQYPLDPLNGEEPPVDGELPPNGTTPPPSENPTEPPTSNPTTPSTINPKTGGIGVLACLGAATISTGIIAIRRKR